ncbi:MAG: oxidoreductase [Nitriliruptorales bacterium]|nr:oxidoreductase [Nitriliruptorales bacterium]
MTTEKTVQRLVAALDYPMVVVTAVAGDTRGGCLVGFTTQCSIHPPRFLVCISRRNATHDVALRSRVLAVHFLDRGDLELAELFGEETADDTDKFTRCEWDEGPDGVPLLRHSAGYVVARVLRHDQVGDHTALLVEAIAAEQRRPFRQLGFQQVRDMEPGHKA